MEHPGLVAVFDHCIAELEECKQQVTREILAAQSSISRDEDTLQDPELGLICEAIDYLKDIREKVIAGEIS